MNWISMPSNNKHMALRLYNWKKNITSLAIFYFMLRIGKQMKILYKRRQILRLAKLVMALFLPILFKSTRKILSVIERSKEEEN